MFHLSERFLGERILMFPRTPKSQCDDELELLPRVCAAPTITQCMMAITGHNESTAKTLFYGKTVWLYYTSDLGYIIDTRIPDQYRTNEVYFIDPVEFVLKDIMVCE